MPAMGKGVESAQGARLRLRCRAPYDRGKEHAEHSANGVFATAL